MKRAVLTLDVEDWYHLDYFDRQNCDVESSMLDGMYRYIDVINSLGIKSSFFVLGEIAERNTEFFRDLALKGHDIGSHGWDHTRPLTMSICDFERDIRRSFEILKKINGHDCFGYRAPCFSLDRLRLDIVKTVGFSYDASRIDFGQHPLYGSLDMVGYKTRSKGVYELDNFFEFEATTLQAFNRQFPISGGGYLRLLPWQLMKYMIQKHLSSNDLYVLYLHPFELSNAVAPEVPSETSFPTKLRFSLGRRKTEEKLKRLVELLRSNGYSFSTFSESRQALMNEESRI
jgi:polysaccharide deacetylase family protein (PEP-CTERM system associated)